MTALGGKIFAQSIQSIHQIHHLFARNFPEGTLENWQHNQFDGYPAIDMANRYLTHRSHALPEQQILLSQTIDPDGILQKAAGDSFVHTEDNSVSYFELLEDNQSGLR